LAPASEGLVLPAELGQHRSRVDLRHQAWALRRADRARGHARSVGEKWYAGMVLVV